MVFNGFQIEDPTPELSTSRVSSGATWGPQTINHGELVALLRFLEDAPIGRPLIFVTDSSYVQKNALKILSDVFPAQHRNDWRRVQALLRAKPTTIIKIECHMSPEAAAERGELVFAWVGNLGGQSHC